MNWIDHIADKLERMKEERFALLLILPSFLVIVGIIIYPILYSAYLSFQRFQLTRSPVGSWVGLNNYYNLFTDENFLYSLSRTFYFTAPTVCLELILGLGIALLLSHKFKGRGICRSFWLIPWAFPPIVNALMWKWVYNGQFGIFNFILLKLGLIDSYVRWLGDPNTTMPLIIAAEVWKWTPFPILIFLAALQGVPKQLEEAARIDGAGVIQVFWHVTLPVIQRAFLILCILQTTWELRAFDIIYGLTKGGPMRSTMVVNYFSYQHAFRYLNIGYGATVAYFLFFITLGFIIFYLRIFGK